MSDPIRVRIAPSPSGHLHVGTARTAVYNWLFARRHGGTFILRIEDTDPERSFDEYTQSIQDSLRWLGLNWDEGPYFQSQRTELYRQWVERLCATDHVFQCWAKPEELDEVRQAAQRAGHAPRFEQISQNMSNEKKAKRESEGFRPAWRLRIPDGPAQFDDIVYGPQQRAGTDIDEFVVARSDGTPTYNFACVIDDADMAISHVIRGNDHITNTFKQTEIYRALGITPPRFAHLPLGLGKDRKKISKREGATSIIEYRELGYLPDAIVNFLALMGWSPGDDREIMTREDMIAAFELERINASNPIFDLQKLDWMNGEYIRRLSDEKLLENVLPYWTRVHLVEESALNGQQERLLKIISTLKERMRLLPDAVDLGAFYFRSDFTYEDKGVRKHFLQPGADADLALLADRFRAIDSSEFTNDSTEEALRSLAEEFGRKPAELIHPLRLALSGRTTGPGLFDIITLLGQEECLLRIDRAVKFIRSGEAVASTSD